MQVSYRYTDSPILDSVMVGLEADNLEKMSHVHKILCRSSRLGQILRCGILTCAKLTRTWQHTLECHKLLTVSSVTSFIV